MEGDVADDLGNGEKDDWKGRGVGARTGHEYGEDVGKGMKSRNRLVACVVGYMTIQSRAAIVLLRKLMDGSCSTTMSIFSLYR